MLETLSWPLFQRRVESPFLHSQVMGFKFRAIKATCPCPAVPDNPCHFSGQQEQGAIPKNLGMLALGALAPAAWDGINFLHVGTAQVLFNPTLGFPGDPPAGVNLHPPTGSA